MIAVVARRKKKIFPQTVVVRTPIKCVSAGSMKMRANRIRACKNPSVRQIGRRIWEMWWEKKASFSHLFIHLSHSLDCLCRVQKDFYMWASINWWCSWCDASMIRVPGWNVREITDGFNWQWVLISNGRNAPFPVIYSTCILATYCFRQSWHLSVSFYASHYAIHNTNDRCPMLGNKSL